MPPKPLSQRVRETSARKRARGLKEIRVWVPDYSEAVQEVRELARRLSGEKRISRMPGTDDRIAEIIARDAMMVPKDDDIVYLLAKVSNQADRIAELERENADFRQTFDFQWEANRRAIKLWQEAAPERDLTWPDHAKMVVWLLERIAALEAELAASKM